MSETGVSRHPIRIVAQRTGLTTPVLRAWERRYGVVHPDRSEGGQRLYSDEDVGRLQLLATAVEGGRSIGRIAELSNEQLTALIEEDRSARVTRSEGSSDPDESLARAIRLVHELQPAELEASLRRAALQLRPHEVVDRIVVPLLEEIGRAWAGGSLGPGTEHVASVAVRRFLEWLIRTIDVSPEAPVLVTGTPSGHSHEFGALLAGVVAAAEGWGVRFLGADLPPEEIARASTTFGARVVALSAIYPPLDPDGLADLRALRAALPADVVLALGGAGTRDAGIRWAEEGIPTFSDLRSFRSWLNDLEDGPSAAGG